MVCNEAEVEELLEPEFKDSAAISIAGFFFRDIVVEFVFHKKAFQFRPCLFQV